MKIEKLNPQQEIDLIKHREEYLKYGLSCDPINKKLAVDSIGKMYGLINKKEPYYWICDSPLQIQIVIQILKNIKLEKGTNLGANLRANLRANLGTNLWANLRDNLETNLETNLGANLGTNLWANLRANLETNLGANLGTNLRANLGANLGANLRANLGANLGDNLRDNLETNLRANLGTNLWANLGANLRANLGANLGTNLWTNLRDNLETNLRANLGTNLRANLGANLRDSDFWGQMDLYWICYYQYPNKFLGIDYGKFQSILNLWEDIGKSCCWWYPYENICFISNRPKEIHKNSRGQLHKDITPALLFRDGYCLWMLNGVSVPQYLVETPEGQLDIEFFKKESNSDIKAEFIRKYGIERMQSLGDKICDAKNHSNEWFRKSEYELINMGSIFNIGYAPHLRMRNLTTGIWHFEAVSPECKTIEEALNFRAKNRVINLQGVA